MGTGEKGSVIWSRSHSNRAQLTRRGTRKGRKDAPTGQGTQTADTRHRGRPDGTGTRIAPPAPPGDECRRKCPCPPRLKARRDSAAPWVSRLCEARAWSGSLSRVPHDQAAPQGAQPGDRRGEQSRDEHPTHRGTRDRHPSPEEPIGTPGKADDGPTPMGKTNTGGLRGYMDEGNDDGRGGRDDARAKLA
jgi:hypothetical protein